jgi:hypothetical protein
MLLLTKNMSEPLAALSAAYPAATANAVLPVLRTIWKVAVAAARWFKSEFTDRGATWRFRSCKVKCNVKTGDYSIDYLSESSTHSAANLVTRTRAKKKRTRGYTAKLPKGHARNGTASAVPKRTGSKTRSTLPKAGVKRIARND